MDGRRNISNFESAFPEKEGCQPVEVAPIRRLAERRPLGIRRTRTKIRNGRRRPGGARVCRVNGNRKSVGSFPLRGEDLQDFSNPIVIGGKRIDVDTVLHHEGIERISLFQGFDGGAGLMQQSLEIVLESRSDSVELPLERLLEERVDHSRYYESEFGIFVVMIHGFP